MNLAEAHATLSTVSAQRPESAWDAPLVMSVQCALAELYLLNPDDDVDGKLGRRTHAAWRMFLDSLLPGHDDTIDASSAQRLIQASGNRAAIIGTPIITLQPDFPFRRGAGSNNRDRSVAPIVQAARGVGMTPPQIAYVLATAEHESAGFDSLEEFSSGEQYEGRADLGNSLPGDGVRFKGRGYVQLTGRTNYVAYSKRSGIRLVDFPFILMNWASLSVFVLVDGMQRGAFTGARLDRFVNGTNQDFREARRVINGLDQADRIAGLANDWLARLAGIPLNA